MYPHVSNGTKEKKEKRKERISGFLSVRSLKITDRCLDILLVKKYEFKIFVDGGESMNSTRKGARPLPRDCKRRKIAAIGDSVAASRRLRFRSSTRMLYGVRDFEARSAKDVS